MTTSALRPCTEWRPFVSGGGRWGWHERWYTNHIKGDSGGLPWETCFLLPGDCITRFVYMDCTFTFFCFVGKCHCCWWIICIGEFCALIWIIKDTLMPPRSNDQGPYYFRSVCLPLLTKLPVIFYLFILQCSYVACIFSGSSILNWHQ